MAGAAGLGILTARLLGPSGKGIYSLPAVEAALVTAAFGGLSSALSHFLLTRNPGKGVFAPAFVTSVLYVVAGTLALIPISMLSGHGWTLLPAALFLPASAAINLAMGYAVGTKRVRYYTSVGVAVTVLTAILMTIGLFLIQRAPAIAIIAWLVSNLIVGGVALTAVLLDARKLQGNDHVTIREFVRFGIKVGMLSLVSLLNYRADLYIVALLTSTADLGMYTVAVSAAESLQVPTQVGALVTSPHIGSLEIPAAARLAARCVRNNLLVAAIVCGILFAVAPVLVRLLYGDPFVPVVPALRVLLIGVFALSLGSPMATYFLLRLGRPEVPLRLAAGSALICIILSLLLIPRLGLVGAAIGSTSGYIVGQVAGIWYFAYSTGLRTATMLVPTKSDIALYRDFLIRIVQDGRRLLRPADTLR